MDQIYHIATLEELKAYLKQQDLTTARQWLLLRFDELRHYVNIKEWNELVRVCEALRIVGWGEREPMEAMAHRWINGSYYTAIQNRYFENREEQGWSKLRDSYRLLEGGDLTYYSIPKFESQRNPLPKTPIRWEKWGNYQTSVRPLFEGLDRLKELVIRKMRPEEYGEALCYVGISLHFSSHDCENESVRSEYFHSEEDLPEGFEECYYIRPRYKFGRLVYGAGGYHLKVDRYFTRAFGELSLSAQQQIVEEDFLYIIEYVCDKLLKKQIVYNGALLKEDMKAIFSEWMKE